MSKDTGAFIVCVFIMDASLKKQDYTVHKIWKHDIRDFIGVFDTDFDPSEMIRYFHHMQRLNKTLQRGVQNRGEFVKDEAACITSSFEVAADLNVVDSYNCLMGQCLHEYVNEYQALVKIPSIQYTVNIQKTLPGEGYHGWHCEKAGAVPTLTRHLTTMVYLNDVEDGGETEFLYQSRRVKPRKGRVVIFPVTWTHTHRGNPPLKGEKMIATSWIHFNLALDS